MNYLDKELDVRWGKMSWLSPSLQPKRSKDFKLWNVLIASIFSCKSGNLQSTWDSMCQRLWNRNLYRNGMSITLYLFRRQSDSSTIAPYASLNNCKAFEDMSTFWNTRLSSAAEKSLSPICSGNPTRESTCWMLSTTNNSVMSKRDFVLYLKLPSAL